MATPAMIWLGPKATCTDKACTFFFKQTAGEASLFHFSSNNREGAAMEQFNKHKEISEGGFAAREKVIEYSCSHCGRCESLCPDQSIKFLIAPCNVNG
ncbi:MAG: hypothetical protein NTV89_19360 [Proteobacteria bacterium]|nr:hypothetical protein [Pseudomonadota bacterium]